MLTRSRGMGASAVLGLAVLASYGALAAVALSAVGGGSVLSFPGWAVDAIIQVNAAPPPPTSQYGSVTATPTASLDGRPGDRRHAARTRGRHHRRRLHRQAGWRGSVAGWLGECGGRRVGRRPRRRLKRRPAAQRPQPARHRTCERHALRLHNRCIDPDQPERRHHDHDGLDSDHHHAVAPPAAARALARSHHHHHAWHHPPRHEHSPPSHHHHHAWHHPPRHEHSPPSHHHHHAWHHPPRHGHHHDDGGRSHEGGSHHHGGHHHDHGGGEGDNGSS